MALILLIETATAVCSVALSLNGEVVAVRELNERNIHAEKITLFIQDVLNEAGSQLADIDAVAVSKGPGSYTGLRIGVSAAKGLCFALDKPLIAINTLDAMATYTASSGRFKNDAVLAPMIDARRMEVYTALYDGSGKVITSVSATVIDENSFSEIPAETQLVIFGDGAAKCAEALSVKHDVMLADAFQNSATHLNTLANQKFAATQFEDVAYFEPYYLKEFIAGVKKTPHN